MWFADHFALPHASGGASVSVSTVLSLQIDLLIELPVTVRHIVFPDIQPFASL